MRAFHRHLDARLHNGTGTTIRRRGFTLVEVMVSILVLTVGVFILSSTVTTAVAHSVVQQERGYAIEAAGNVVEDLHAVPFSELFALYNDVDYDDPDGPGTAPGMYFDIPALEPRRTATGEVLPIGQVILPSASGILREDVTIPELGMPRDLDGDLVIDGFDHSRDYLILPVVVRITWDSRTGPRSYQMQTMLGELGKL